MRTDIKCCSTGFWPWTSLVITVKVGVPEHPVGCFLQQPLLRHWLSCPPQCPHTRGGKRSRASARGMFGLQGEHLTTSDAWVPARPATTWTGNGSKHFLQCSHRHWCSQERWGRTMIVPVWVLNPLSTKSWRSAVAVWLMHVRAHDSLLQLVLARQLSIWKISPRSIEKSPK